MNDYAKERMAQHEGYKDPGIVAWCRRLKPQEQGYPYANQLYRGEAEKFANGQTINWMDASESEFFSIGDQEYQVVSGRGCLDIIKRNLIKRAGARAA